MTIAHDLRRTFISLALADGGRKDILRWITHGPKGDVFDDYTTLPWTSLCEEVAKLKVEFPSRVSHRMTATGGSSSGSGGPDRVTFGVTVAGPSFEKQTQAIVTTHESGTLELAGWTGLEDGAGGELERAEVSRASGIGHLRVVGGAADEREGAEMHSGCNTVTQPDEVDGLRVCQMLESAIQGWRRHQSTAELRRQLLRLLLELEAGPE